MKNKHIEKRVQEFNNSVNRKFYGIFFARTKNKTADQIDAMINAKNANRKRNKIARKSRQRNR